MIAHDEAIKGSSYKIRAALLDNPKWESPVLPIEASWPGSDFVWLTDHDPYKVVGVQRKTVTDFISSWRDGRLQDQMFKLLNCVDIPILIIEGPCWINWKTHGLVTQYGEWHEKGKPVPYSTYTESLADLTGNCPGNFFLVMTADIRHTIEWLLETGPRKFDNDDYKGWERQAVGQRSTSKAFNLFLAMEGLGYTRAEEVWKKYNTYWAAVDALRSGGWSVPGVGKITEEKILNQGNTGF